MLQLSQQKLGTISNALDSRGWRDPEKKTKRRKRRRERKWRKKSWSERLGGERERERNEKSSEKILEGKEIT